MFPLWFVRGEVHRCGRGDRKSEGRAVVLPLSRYFSTLVLFTFCHILFDSIAVFLEYSKT